MAAVERERRDHRQVRQVRPAAVGVVDQPDLAGRGALARGRRRRPPASPPGGRGSRPTARPCAPPPSKSAVLQSRRSLMFGLKAAADQGGLHLLGHGAQRVGHDLERDGVHGAHPSRSRTSWPVGSTRAVQPSPTQQVAPSIGTTAGPRTGSPASPAAAPGRRPGARPPGAASPPRRAARVRVAVAAAMGLVEGRGELRLGRARVPVDGQRVALADVAAVDRGAPGRAGQRLLGPAR